MKAKESVAENNDVIILIAKTSSEMEKIQNEWNSFKTISLANYYYFRNLLSYEKNKPLPYIMVVKIKNNPEALIIGKILEITKELKLFKNLCIKIPIKRLDIGCNCIVGSINKDNSKIIISEIINSLKRGEADEVHFSEIDIKSDFYNAVKKTSSIFSRDYFPIKDMHYKMTLPKSMEVYYDSHKKLKKTIRQRIAKIKSVSSGNIEIKYFKEEKQIDQFCFEAEIISKKSFQNIYGSGFENNDKNNAIIKYLAKRGEFRGYVFYVKEKPCGYWAGFINHDTFYPLPFGGTGYDPYFKNYSIGTLLMYKMIEDLSCDGKVKYLDFGIMDKKYKKDLCDISWEEISFNIFKPKFKGVCLNILRIFNYYEKIIEKKFKRNKLNFADN